MCPNRYTATDEELLDECTNNFYLTATVQGRLSYVIMSVHAVNPTLIPSLINRDPTYFLYSNMLYGTALHLFSRPHMRSVNIVHRLSFSILGSMMFNYSSLQVYEWLTERFQHRPHLLIFLGFISGRLMMVHLIAYLYHVDTRSITYGPYYRRDFTFETMYLLTL